MTLRAVVNIDESLIEDFVETYNKQAKITNKPPITAEEIGENNMLDSFLTFYIYASFDEFLWNNPEACFKTFETYFFPHADADK
jgi:hypothetical protein